MAFKTLLTPADKTRLSEIIMGGVPTSAALVEIEELVQEKVNIALAEHGVFKKKEDM